MLDGHIDVFDYLGVACDFFDKSVGDAAGIAVEQPQPANPVDGRQLAQQRVERVCAVQVLAVARGVLRDEAQLPHAERRKLPRLLHDFAHRPRAEAAADGRDHAIGAAVVAALRNLQIREMLLRGDDALPAERRGVDVAEARERLFRIRAAHRLADVAVGAGAEYAVDLGHLLQKLLAIAFGQATRDHDAAEGVVFLQPGDVEDVVNRLLLGAFDKRAGIDDDHVRVDVLGDDLEALCGELCEHDLRID